MLLYMKSSYWYKEFSAHLGVVKLLTHWIYSKHNDTELNTVSEKLTVLDIQMPLSISSFYPFYTLFT